MLINIDKYALFGKNNVIFEFCDPKNPQKHVFPSKRMFYFNLKKLTFSWQKLTYLGTEGSNRKTDARFGFSGSGLPIKLHF